MNLSVKPSPKAEMAYKNQVFVHPTDHASLQSFSALSRIKDIIDVEILGKVWACASSADVVPGTVALSMMQRSFAGAAMDVVVPVRVFTHPKDKPFALTEVKFRVAPLSKPKSAGAIVMLEADKLTAEIKVAFKDQIMAPGLKLAHIYQGTTALSLEVVGLRLASALALGESTEQTAAKSQFSFEPELGMFVDKLTELNFVKSDGVQIKGQVTERSVNKMLEVNFEALGIGGLDKEFTQIFRRAFASRVYPPEMVASMGINHVRGLILFGPPGCGKTLIARQISKALQTSTSAEEKRREPKIVNGPEILSKFVGEAEKNIRELFSDAEAEQKEFGNDSELHVIIFDEFDAIAKKRGSSRDGTGVHDSIVNQLLSKIDGVNALNNVLLIAMTNRLDMLDPALLRPGRFEVQVEISLPDEHGRTQILNIHTAKMRKAGYLAPDVVIQSLAERTKNFTGAEIEGLVKDAGGFAFQRQVDTKNFKVVDAKALQVTMTDFEEALKECRPQFGTMEVEEEIKRNLGMLVPFSTEFLNVQKMLGDLTKRAAQETRESSSMSLVSVLLCGEPGSGKTALATKIAHESGFPMIRIISPDKLIGMSEQTKSAAIADIFDEAYKSEKSLILLEDIERIIDYTRLGPRFSNQVLQTLLILIRKPPPKKGKRVFILATTSIPELMEPLDVVSVFNMVLHVPQVKTEEEVTRVIRQIVRSEANEDEILAVAQMCPLPISVKKLMLALDMAQREGPLDRESFGEFLAVT